MRFFSNVLAVAKIIKMTVSITFELDVIVVRKERATRSHYDLHLRRSVVLHVMKRLIEHINHDYLALLPANENLTILTVLSDEDEASATQNADSYITHLVSTFVPMPARS